MIEALSDRPCGWPILPLYQLYHFSAYLFYRFTIFIFAPTGFSISGPLFTVASPLQLLPFYSFCGRAGLTIPPPHGALLGDSLLTDPPVRTFIDSAIDSSGDSVIGTLHRTH